MKFIFYSIFCFILLNIPTAANGVVLYLESSQKDYRLGDVFMADIRVDVQENECINTAEIYISSEPRILEIKDFSEGDSIISIWLKKPEFSKETGLVSFVGGIPGGYCGELAGDPGKSNLLGTIIFEVEKESEITEVKFLDSSQILLNDGLGTPAKVEKRVGVFNILSGIPEITREEWQERLERDKIPPEPFSIEVRQDSSVFEDKYFLTFLTTDKQTGIDRYEIKEGEGEWKEITTPYLLEDQELKSIIKVRAVDKAGNERIVGYAPSKPISTHPISYFKIWLILISIILVIIWLIRKRYLSCLNPKS